jgi:hypothetical protein
MWGYQLYRQKEINSEAKWERERKFKEKWEKKKKFFFKKNDNNSINHRLIEFS